MVIDKLSAREFETACRRSRELRKLLRQPPFLVKGHGPRPDTVKLNLTGLKLDVTSLMGTRLEVDAVQRDLSFNALYVELETAEVLDPCGGVADLRQRVARSPHPEGPLGSVREDPSRLLRALGFAARFGFQPEERWLDEGMAQLLRACPLRRLLFQLKKSLLLHNRPSRFLDSLELCGAHSLLFGDAAGRAWQSSVTCVARLEELVLEGLARGILTSRSVAWRGRRHEGRPSLLAPDWRLTGIAENDWVELLFATLLWRCSPSEIMAVGKRLQVSKLSMQNVLTLQQGARRCGPSLVASYQTVPMGAWLLSAAVSSDAPSSMWDAWPKPERHR